MSDEPAVHPPVTSRRALFAGAGALGASAVVLAACGSDEPADGSGDRAPGAGPPGGGADGGGQPGPGGEDTGGTVLATVNDVEVGGGMIVSAESVVVTQPTEGDFKGFSAICTHEGCILSRIVDREIICGCHGSRYSIEDGAVLAGAHGADPSTQSPLTEVPLTVEGNEIIRA